MGRMYAIDLLKIVLLLIISALLACCAGNRGNVFPLAEGYTLEGQVFARCRSLLELDPTLVRLNVIGFSGTENLPIYALDIGWEEAPREILIIGQHHGDEVLGVEIALGWAEELARGAGADGKIAAILDEYRFLIIPTINPEGYRVISEGLYQHKRKNNRDTDGNGRLDLHSDGVDLNRNYPVFWDEDRVLPPTHQNYKGDAPASEPEIRAVLSLAQKQDFELAIFYHSSPTGSLAEKIFLPAMDPKSAKQLKRYNSLIDFTRFYASNLKKDYTKGKYELSTIPGTRMGTARNYFFHIQETQAFLIETGGVNKDGISVIHPPARKKDSIVSKHVKALRKVFHATLSE
jgi:hypothetical protein